MADSVLVAVVSGLAGAILGGFGQAAVARYAAFKEAQAAAASIRAEIVSLRELVEKRRYLETLNGIVVRLGQPGAYVPDRGDVLQVAVTQDYFQVFAAHCGKLGTLGDVAADVVSVYTIAKACVEDLRTFHALADKQPLPGRDLLLPWNTELRDLMVELLAKSRATVDRLEEFQRRRFYQPRGFLP